MDQIYFWILILFLIILVLDYTDKYFKKNKENFHNQYITNEISGSTITPYFEENRLFTYEPPYSSNAVNIYTNNNIGFKNFGTNGITPPFLKCPSCNLQFDCTNFPYEVDDKNQSVCNKCFTKISLDDNNMPVYARAAGKPRVCRDLNKN
jgi:hypothetical protein